MQTTTNPVTTISVAGEEYALKYHKVDGQYIGVIPNLFITIPPQNTLAELKTEAEYRIIQHNAK